MSFLDQLIEGATALGLAKRREIDGRPHASKHVTWPPTFDKYRNGFNLGEFYALLYPDRTKIVGTRTPEQIIDSVSTCRSAPGTTVYIDIDLGNDTTGNGTLAAPYQSWSKAWTVINAAGLPAKLYVKGRTPSSVTHYNRTLGPAGASGTAGPTVDVAVMAFGNDVICTVTDGTFTTTDDGSGTNTYTCDQSIANVQQAVWRLGAPDAQNNLPRLQRLTTVSRVRQTPGSYCLISNVLTIHMHDGSQPTTTNLWVMREIPNFLCTSNVNIYFGSEDGSLFRFYGGGGTAVSFGSGAIDIAPATLGAQKHLVVATNVEMRYSFRGWGVESFHGLVLSYNDDVGGLATDYANCHNQRFSNAAVCGLICINPTGAGLGLFASGFASCNMGTAHELNSGVALIGGAVRLSAGGMVRSIGASDTFGAFTVLDTDLGDRWLGASVIPTLFGMYESAVGYMQGLRFRGPNSQYATWVDPGAQLYGKDMEPHEMRVKGTVTAW